VTPMRVGIAVAADGGGWDDWAAHLPDDIDLHRLPLDGDWPSGLDRIVFEASPFDLDRTALAIGDRRRGLAGPPALCVALPCRPTERSGRRARMTLFRDLLAGVPGPLAVLDLGALQDEHVATGDPLDAMLLTEAGRPTPPLALTIGLLVGAWLMTGDAAALATGGAAAMTELAVWHAAYAQRWSLTLPADLRTCAGDIRRAALTADTLPRFMAVAGDLFTKLGHAKAAALFEPTP